MRSLLFAGVLFGSLWTPVALAEGAPIWITGNKLYQYCREGSSDREFAECTGYIAGVIDMHDTMVRADRAKCSIAVPADAPMGQVVDIVIKHMADDPAGRGASASTITLLALFDAFGPCKS